MDHPGQLLLLFGHGSCPHLPLFQTPTGRSEPQNVSEGITVSWPSAAYISNVSGSHPLLFTSNHNALTYRFLEGEKKRKKRRVYAGQRPRTLREGPLTGKPEASPEKERSTPAVRPRALRKGAGTECEALLNPEMAIQSDVLFVFYSVPIAFFAKLVWAPMSMMPLGFHAKVVTGKA
eukprot:1145059-Pelagomonas_calceolata.AAC.8